MLPPVTRRYILRLLAGAPLFAANVAVAAPAKVIGRLIAEARTWPRVSQRIKFISRSLLGIRYQADTLIGGPNYPERFVVRDDAFDCVTYCEVVLAAGIASDFDTFGTALRRIRYDHGKVRWDQRNHYFADWCKRNIDNGICEPVTIEPSIVIEKTLTWHREFGKHRVLISAIPTTALFGNSKMLSPGDIIGFASHRADLDYFHTGLIAFGKDQTLLLRHASQSHGRVVDEKMTTFVSVNPVRYVTLLRASDKASAVESH